MQLPETRSIWQGNYHRLAAIRRKEYGNEEAKCSKPAFLLEIVHFDFKPLFHVHEWQINLHGRSVFVDNLRLQKPLHEQLNLHNGDNL
jgi:hypothetical protein